MKAIISRTQVLEIKYYTGILVFFHVFYIAHDAVRDTIKQEIGQSENFITTVKIECMIDLFYGLSAL